MTKSTTHSPTKKHGKKKKAKHPEHKKPTVSIVVQKQDPAVDPIVVSFPSGLPRGLVENDTQDIPKFAWKQLDQKRKHGRYLVGSDNVCVYQGQNQGRGHDGRRTKLCVGVYDKQTQTLTLHQAAQRGTVYALRQSVPTYQNDVTSGNNLTAMERHRVLFESFGSAKKQRVLKSQQANVVNVDSVIGAGHVMMDAIQNQSTMSESNRKAMQESQTGNKMDAVEVAYAEARKKFLPAFDIDAKEPHLVYDARDMAGDDVWKQVGRVVGACMHRQEQEEAGDSGTSTNNWIDLVTSKGWWADSVSSLLSNISPLSPHAKYQVKCGILLNQMINFHNQTQARNNNFLKGTPEELTKFLHVPLESAERFLSIFGTPMTNEKTGRDGYACSKQDRDKCRVHILLLYLMASGFPTMKVGNIAPVVNDMKMETSQAANLLRAAGCTVTKRGTSNVWSAALSVPLKFPQPKRARGKS